MFTNGVWAIWRNTTKSYTDIRTDKLPEELSAIGDSWYDESMLSVIKVINVRSEETFGGDTRRIPIGSSNGSPKTEPTALWHLRSGIYWIFALWTEGIKFGDKTFDQSTRSRNVDQLRLGRKFVKVWCGLIRLFPIKIQVFLLRDAHNSKFKLFKLYHVLLSTAELSNGTLAKDFFGRFSMLETKSFGI